MVKSGEKMGVEGIWLREENGGPKSFSLGPPFSVILESPHLGRKYGERGACEKLLIYPYLLPHVIVVFFIAIFFSFKLLIFFM